MKVVCCILIFLLIDTALCQVDRFFCYHGEGNLSNKNISLETRLCPSRKCITFNDLCADYFATTCFEESNNRMGIIKMFKKAKYIFDNRKWEIKYCEFNLCNQLSNFFNPWNIYPYYTSMSTLKPTLETYDFELTPDAKKYDTWKNVIQNMVIINFHENITEFEYVTEDEDIFIMAGPMILKNKPWIQFNWLSELHQNLSMSKWRSSMKWKYTFDFPNLSYKLKRGNGRPQVSPMKDRENTLYLVLKNEKSTGWCNVWINGQYTRTRKGETNGTLVISYGGKWENIYVSAQSKQTGSARPLNFRPQFPFNPKPKQLPCNAKPINSNPNIIIDSTIKKYPVSIAESRSALPTFNYVNKFIDIEFREDLCYNGNLLKLLIWSPSNVSLPPNEFPFSTRMYLRKDMEWSLITHLDVFMDCPSGTITYNSNDEWNFVCYNKAVTFVNVWRIPLKYTNYIIRRTKDQTCS